MEEGQTNAGTIESGAAQRKEDIIQRDASSEMWLRKSWPYFPQYIDRESRTQSLFPDRGTSGGSIIQLYPNPKQGLGVSAPADAVQCSAVPVIHARSINLQWSHPSPCCVAVISSVSVRERCALLCIPYTIRSLFVLSVIERICLPSLARTESLPQDMEGKTCKARHDMYLSGAVSSSFPLSLFAVFECPR
jgi:hypothetical protein